MKFLTNFIFICIVLITSSFSFSLAQVSFNISKTGSITADPGNIITYVITYSNTGIQNATNVIITDYLPGSGLYSEEPLDVISNPAGTYNSSTHTITWDQSHIPGLANLGAGSYQIVVQIKAGTKGDGISGSADGYYMPDTINTLFNYVTIESNEVTAPVPSDTTITLVGQFCNLLVNSVEGAIKSATGTSIYYLMQITNTGNIYDKFSLLEMEYTCPPPDDNFDPLTASIEDLDGNVISSTDWMYPGETYLFYLKSTTPTGTNPGKINCRDVIGNSFICPGITASGSTKTEVVGSPKGPIVSILKIDDPDPVERGDTITYIIYAFNSNDKYDAYNFVITESYDPNLTFVSADPVPTIGDSVWILGTLEYGPDSSTTITVKATVNESSSCSGSILNTVTADFTDASSVPYTQVFRTITSQIQSFPDVVVTKTATPSPFPAEVGGNITYNISYANIGTCVATGIVVIDDYDQLHTNVISTGGGTDNGNIITWNLPFLNPGDSGIFSYSVEIDTAATFNLGTTVIPNTAIIGCEVIESDYNNNFDSEIVSLLILPDLVINKTVNNNEIYVEQPNTYSVSVSNDGDIATTNVLIIDTLPAELSFISASDGGTNSGGIITWPAIDTLDVGDTVTRTVTVETTCFYTDSTVINKATVISDFLDADDSNNTVSLSSSVKDSIFPTALCQNVTVYLDSSGSASIDTSNINNGSSDNCGIDTIYLSTYTFNCADTGANIVTLTVKDISGNSSNCISTVTVLDTVRPVIVCPAPSDTTIYVDSSCDYSLADFTGLATITDNCDDISTVTTTQSPVAGTVISGEGTTQLITLTADDGNGNINTCSFTVTLEDTIKPVISCPAPSDTTIYVDGSCDYSLADFTGLATITDNCDDISTVTTTQSPVAGTVISGEGTTQLVTLTADDGNGNINICSFTVTLEDTIKPVISCPAPSDTTIYVDGSCDYSLADFTGLATITDNCDSLSTVTTTQSPVSGTVISGEGTTQLVTLTADDGNGNINTCSFTITLEDTIKPVISCPAPSDTTIYVDGSCDYSLADFTGLATITDNCDDISTVTTTQSPLSGTVISGEGTTQLVTLTADDGNGNINTCSFTVTLEDTIKPVISCPAPSDTTIYVDSSCDYSLADFTGLATITDNCDSLSTVTTTQSPVAGTVISGEGTTQLITLTADDGNGNINTCSFTVTLEDTIKPVISCPAPSDTTIYVDGSCDYSLADFTGLATITDNCDDISTVTTTQSPVAGTVISGEGTTQLVTLTADDGNGNINTCSFTITLEDTIKPVISCPAPSDTTIYVDSSCDYSLADFTGLATITDNCDSLSTVTTTQSPVSGTVISGEGTTQLVTLTADDGNGNTNTCSFTVTLEDTIKPVISCPAPSDTTIYVDGSCDYSLADFTGLATITDNCDDISTVTTTQSPVAGTVISGEGTTQLVTLTADDGNGNTNTCSFTVTLEDTIKPVISCPAPSDTTIYVDGSCDYSLADFTGLATITDNCDDISTVTTTQSPVAGTVISGEGTTQLVTLTADDGNGNINTCSFTITLEDTIKPVISCPAPSDTTIYVDGSCDYSLADFTGLATITDNCDDISTVTTTQSPLSGTVISGEGTTQLVTLTADDGNGNINTCSFTITLEDTIKPVISCPAPSDTTIYVDGSCDYSLADFTGLATITDNCDSLSTVTTTQSPVSGTVISGEGTTQLVTLTADDGNGNTNTCSFTVTLEDTIKPVISCPAPSDTTIYVDGSCDYSLADFTGLATITDNCDDISTVTTTQSPVAGTVISGEGTTQLVTLTADDGNGNTNTCSFTVTLEDTIKPVISCPAPSDTTIYVDGSCDYSLADFTGLATITDNCDDISTVTTTQSPVAGTVISGEGTTQLVTLTADDGNGNINTCSFTITLEDTIKPVISCPVPSDTTIYVDGSCDYSLADFTGLATITDNCDDISTVTTTQSPVAGMVISGEGTTQLVTLTADDGNGNINTCSFTITLEDTIKPVISCPAPSDTTIYVDSSCDYSLADFTGLATITDNCDDISTVTTTQSPVSGTVISGEGTTQLVTLTADDGNGNINTCSFTITLEDTIKPVISCPAPSDTTIYVDGSCDYSLADFTGLATITDNCDDISTVTTTQSPVAGTVISGEGTTQLVTLTADDGNGNINTCSFTVTLEDTIKPVISCPAPSDTTIYVDGSCDYSLADFTGLATITDNCDSLSTVTTTQSPVSGTVISGEGTTQLVTLTADDGNGNINTCSFTVTLEDTIKPVISCPAPSDTTIYVDGSCDYSLADFTGLATITDNCDDISTVTTTQSPVAGTVISGEGTTQLVTLTADDGNGNINTCSFTIKLEDTKAPTVSCKDVTLSLDEDGQLEIDEQHIVTEASDGCGNVTLDISKTEFDCNDIGRNTVAVTATDESGNTTVCEAVVTVVDDSPPVTMCRDITAVIGIDEIARITASDVDDGSFDNCNVELTIDKEEFTCEEMGDHTVTLTATDPSGNSSDCNANVTVVDDQIKENCCTEIKVSQLLTPNGDGLNDVLLIDELDCYGDNELCIIGRWGNQIYYKKNYGQDGELWGGELNNHFGKGKVLPGTYFYIIILNGNKENVKKGFIHIQW